MDGISVAASVVGLLAVAAKITSTLNAFIINVREAPKLARTVLREIADISACLNQVQSLLLGAGKINAPNQSLLMVDDLDVILSNCVVIFSELEELAEGLKADQPIQAIDILKWTMKEKTISALLSRLHSSKASLNLMISTLTCSSIEDARSTVDQLAGIVRQLVENSEDTYTRLGRIESKSLETVPTTSRTTHDFVHESIIEDNESAVTIRRLETGSPPHNAPEITASKYAFDFERLLESSRPYVRAAKRPQPPASATSGSHMVDFFDAVLRMDRYKPLPPIPDEPREGVTKNEYPSINSNFDEEVGERSKHGGRHSWKDGALLTRQPNSKENSTNITADLSAPGLEDGWVMDENIGRLSAARRNAIYSSLSSWKDVSEQGGRQI
ncbi:MAG: hypothetical protein LQ351_003409 [Letrouitia transgressa]|nr:MAG: hypothetical protein LQ351_003409 [Letrouitia transgressa]